MTSNKLVKIVSFIGAMFVASTASAGVIVDVVTQNEKVDGFWNPHSYVHDINDNGFVLGTAQSGSLSINIHDDADGWGEIAVITVELFDFDTGAGWGQLIGSATAGWANDLGIEALVALNSSGLLQVKVSSLLVGDFWVGNSTLTVNTVDPVAAPEPGMLSLIALSLMGLAGVSRRRRMS